MSDTPSKPQVYRCDGDNADCNPAQPHWLAIDTRGTVTSWRSWHRAMFRALKNY